MDERGDRLVVVVGAQDRLLEDRRVGGDAAQRVLVAQARELAARDQAAADLVKPRGGAGRDERGEVWRWRCGVRLPSEPPQCPSGGPSSAPAASTIAPVVIPKCSYTAASGPEAPKPRIAMIAPRSPTQRCQPNALAASTAIRAVPGGRAPRSRVGRVQRLEAVHARHADDADRDALSGQLIGGGDAQPDLRAGGDQHQLGRAVAVAQHVGAALDRVERDAVPARARPATGARARARSASRSRCSAKLQASAVS